MGMFQLPLLLDGATGTNLMRAGMPAGICVEQWILEHPDVLTELQKAYAAAGSRAVTAPTFEANRYKLARHGLGDRVKEINRRLVELSRNAVGPDVLIAGNLSPTGLMVEPFGDTTFDELVEIFREQVFALRDAGVDYIAAETMMSLTEARAALLAARETGLDVTVTLTVEAGGRTLSGGDIAAGLFTLSAMGAAAVGVNCSTGPEAVLKALKAGAPYVACPMIAKPNAGLPIEGRPGEYDVTPEQFADYLPAFLDAGAGLIGGCCGTTPEHIARLSKKLAEIGGTYAAKEKAAALRCADERHLYEPSREELGEACEIFCDENFSENLLSLASEGVAARVIFKGEEEIEEFVQSSYLSRIPLVFCSEDAALLEKVLKVYQGIALVDGGSLKAEDRQRFSSLYGAVLV